MKNTMEVKNIMFHVDLNIDDIHLGFKVICIWGAPCICLLLLLRALQSSIGSSGGGRCRGRVISFFALFVRRIGG